MSKHPMVTAKIVMVLGSPAGNLWDIFFGEKFACRVSYHGNDLHVVKNGHCQVMSDDAEKAIAELYPADGSKP